MCLSFLEKGIPNVLAQGGRTKRVPEDLLPTSAAAAERYRELTGTPLTMESAFGADPFISEDARVRAETLFRLRHPDLTVVYNATVNRHYQPLQECLIDLINITRNHL